MAIGIIPVGPIGGAPAVVADDAAFVPGTEVSARVLKMLGANQVRIAVGAMAYDLRTTVALEPGQMLRLAVTQAQDGLRLAVIMPQEGEAGGAAANPAGTSARMADGMMRSVQAVVSASDPAVSGLVTKLQVTPQEAVAVSQAAQSAVARHGSLSQLFANLGVAANAPSLPVQVQQAAAQAMLMRPPLDEKLSAKDLKAAIRQSGNFMESQMASGTGAAPRGDMKAALTVLRHVLAGFAAPDDAEMTAGKAATTAMPAQLSSAATAKASLAPSLPQAAQTAVVPTSTSISPATSPATAQAATAPMAPSIVPASPAAALAKAVANVTLDPLVRASLLSSDDVHQALTRGEAQQGKANAVLPYDLSNNARPPLSPPVRGALPVAQPIAMPNLSMDEGAAQVSKQLLGETDAALARQTLHQIASLPERLDTISLRQDAPLRLSFDIPFAHPQGTAVAQFEIAEERDTNGPTGQEKSWQARFTLDIEPAGPVHVSITLRGEETSVRMFAERSETAKRLRAGTRDLAQALVRAELKPGDISVREGAPSQPPPVGSGHFLDRAS